MHRRKQVPRKICKTATLSVPCHLLFECLHDPQDSRQIASQIRANSHKCRLLSTAVHGCNALVSLALRMPLPDRTDVLLAAAFLWSECSTRQVPFFSPSLPLTRLALLTGTHVRVHACIHVSIKQEARMYGKFVILQVARLAVKEKRKDM